MTVTHDRHKFVTASLLKRPPGFTSGLKILWGFWKALYVTVFKGGGDKRDYRTVFKNTWGVGNGSKPLIYIISALISPKLNERREKGKGGKRST
jgi:hypothetical protein